MASITIRNLDNESQDSGCAFVQPKTVAPWRKKRDYCFQLPANGEEDLIQLAKTQAMTRYRLKMRRCN